MIDYNIIATGSKGNAVVIDQKILIDCGVSFKGTFSIDKVLRTKIENILLKMISFWQQYFFRDLMENGKLRNFGVPVPDVPDSNSQQDTKRDAPQDDSDNDDEPSEDSAEDDTEE